MKVRISDLTPTGLHIREELPLERLNERMSEGKNQEIEFTSPPKVDVTVRGNASGAEMTGTITSRYRQPCSLCLDDKERTVSVDTSFLLQQRSPGMDAENDIGIVYYEGEHADLDSILEEELILSLSLFWHPPFDESERCTECRRLRSELGLGAERSGATLGDLLKEKLGKG